MNKVNSQLKAWFETQTINLINSNMRGRLQVCTNDGCSEIGDYETLKTLLEKQDFLSLKEKLDAALGFIQENKELFALERKRNISRNINKTKRMNFTRLFSKLEYEGMEGFFEENTLKLWMLEGCESAVAYIYIPLFEIERLRDLESSEDAITSFVLTKKSLLRKENARLSSIFGD